MAGATEGGQRSTHGPTGLQALLEQREGELRRAQARAWTLEARLATAREEISRLTQASTSRAELDKLMAQLEQNDKDLQITLEQREDALRQLAAREREVADLRKQVLEL